MKKVLILSFDRDPHVLAVCSHLQTGNYFLLNTDKISERYQISFSSKTSIYTVKDLNEDRTLALDSSWNIWNRRIVDPEMPTNIPRDLAKIVADETKKTLQGMLLAHRGKVVNYPSHEYLARSKLHQISLASTLNHYIRVPSTLVTNNPDELRAFYEAHQGHVCFKLQKGAIADIGDKKMTVLTSKVKPEHLSDESLLRQSPILFQEYIAKEYEVRATVIGQEVIGTAIHSQEAEISRVDYRRYDFSVPYKKLKLPVYVQEFCLAMLESYGLYFGAFDFIVTKEKNFVFLELNSNGQWLWLEQLSGSRISKSLADYLIK